MYNSQGELQILQLEKSFQVRSDFAVWQRAVWEVWEASLSHWLCAQCDKKSDLAVHSETTILIGKVETIFSISVTSGKAREGKNYNPM